MSKMITYWKSNAEKEFGFYGKQSKDKQKLNEAELNKRVTEALAEVDDINQDNDEIEESTVDSTNRNIRSNANKRRTTSGELILEDNSIVLIEHLWIETNVDLSNKRILEDIGEIPDDADDNYIDDENVNTDGESCIEGKEGQVIIYYLKFFSLKVHDFYAIFQI
ncbi:hypothetical protein RhiirA1_403360 [Rhizophagus irregularis]|uniref:Uncharacterized protein n=1 Tax=Rhizophagus irregularis TaxID=588596 RepID=A0A2N0QUR7_9GLOM|nr:hypothetical protein RhiirA1_403360 [Rhizophagus irregularis]